MNNRVLVAMSGGVDSAVAALLLKEEGYDCVGATMELYPGCSAGAVNDARSVAEYLKIPFYPCDFSEDFLSCVTEPFVSAYARGRTPNPCVLCNRRIKFGKLLERAGELGCDRIATGHYARVERDPGTGRYILKKAADPLKDQSYVLYTLSQGQLSHVIFPLGGTDKARVRAVAAKSGLPCADRPESQDICFIPDGDYAGFIEKYAGTVFPEGDFIDTEGKVMGRHRGIIRYTVGQRKGLGIAFGEPKYVLRVDPEENTVTLGTDRELYSDSLFAGDINLISRGRIEEPMRVAAKVRYRHPEQPATVIQTGEDVFRVAFDEPQRAITPGQAVVLYDGETVVGGGTISL